MRVTAEGVNGACVNAAGVNAVNPSAHPSTHPSARPGSLWDGAIPQLQLQRLIKSTEEQIKQLRSLPGAPFCETGMSPA